MNLRRRKLISRSFIALAILLTTAPSYAAQSNAARAALGSRTAKAGFLNETEIRGKFNNWRTDSDARLWLAAMGYSLATIQGVAASKPHGEKSDVEVRVRTVAGEKVEGISIKLVSSPTGFNQIDKRWLSNYAKMWRMPANVQNALNLFVGETSPVKAGRAPDRIFLNELEPEAQKAVVDFFESNKEDIVSDLFRGDGVHAAGWIMVAFKATANTLWRILPIGNAIRFYSQGPVVITRRGNLKLGRITVQRKGGDGGRPTAKMLQFKINPALILENN